MLARRLDDGKRPPDSVPRRRHRYLNGPGRLPLSGFGFVSARYRVRGS